MSTTSYPPPVDKLLTYGDCRKAKWPDYLALGFGPEHIPDLIRMATDSELNWGNPGSLEVWAPTHAWRTLGQLGAADAVEPLLGILDELAKNHDDWGLEELPVVFGHIGPAAIFALASYLADESHELFARVRAAHGLEEIGNRHPEARGKCIAILTKQLEQFADNDPTLNGLLIAHLLDLKAIEAVPVMQRAFEVGSVDLTVAGDWEDVQVELGLKAKRETPRPRPPFFDWIDGRLDSLPDLPVTGQETPRSYKTKAKKRDKRQPGERLRGQRRKKKSK